MQTHITVAGDLIIHLTDPALLRRIEKGIEHLSQEFVDANAKLDSIDASFAGVAADIDAIKVALADAIAHEGGMTVEEGAALVARLGDLSDRVAAKDAED